MTTFRLLAGSATPAPAATASPDHVDCCLESWTPPPGGLSLPAEMAGRLVALRTEHAAWAYGMGKMRLGDGRTLADALTGGAPLSMWWCSLLYERHPKMTPGLHEAYLLRTLELLMEERGGDALETVGCRAAANRALRAMCSGHGWRFAARDEAADGAAGASLLRRLYARTPAILRCLARFAHWLATVRRHLPATKGLPPSPVPTGTVVTYFPNIDLKLAQEGIFRSRYWESLHDALGEAGSPAPVRWLFVRFPSPQGSLAHCCELRDRFAAQGTSGVSFHYLEEFLTAADLGRALLRWLRLAIASFSAQGEARAAFRLPGSALDLWPLLGYAWAESLRGWRCLDRCLQDLGLRNYVAAAGPQRWYTFPLENCPWERMLTAAVHAAGTGPVYGAQHSTIRPTDLRYFDDARTWSDPATAAFQPDRVLGNGSSACAQWAEAGVPQERLGKIEALRYLYLAGEERPRIEGRPTRLLVVTSFFEDETMAHLRLLAEAIRARLLEGLAITVKPHPYLPVKARLEALLGRRAEELQFASGPMSDALATNPLVWASNSTTVALEAAIKGLPVMVMQPSGDFDLCPLQDVKELPRTSDLESVARALETARPLDLDPGYLCLDRGLPRWRALLGLPGAGERRP